MARTKSVMVYIYPLRGCTAIPLGLDILSIANSTLRAFVSKLATSIVNFLESVQKMFLEDQSTAIPSGDFTPEISKNDI